MRLKWKPFIQICVYVRTHVSFYGEDSPNLDITASAVYNYSEAYKITPEWGSTFNQDILHLYMVLATYKLKYMHMYYPKYGRLL